MSAALASYGESGRGAEPEDIWTRNVAAMQELGRGRDPERLAEVTTVGMAASQFDSAMTAQLLASYDTPNSKPIPRDSSPGSGREGHASRSARPASYDREPMTAVCLRVCVLSRPPISELRAFSAPRPPRPPRP